MVLSVALSLLLGEGMARIACKPIDYLYPTVIDDPVLGFRIKPNSAGHDAWGYRNAKIPSMARIVAIGDSQTYGVSATSDQSWPAHLQRLTGSAVYNLALPGLDPVDYGNMLRDEAVKLNPALVVVGLYLGNDLSEAYRNVYGRNIETDLISRNFVPPDKPTPKSAASVDDNKGKRFGSLRRQLARQSVFYRLLSFSVADRLKFGQARMSGGDNGLTVLDDPESGIQTAFTPEMRRGALDIDDPRIREGLRICLACFERMNRICESRQIKMVVLIIPTKESVYSRFLLGKGTLNNRQAIDELIRSEAGVALEIKKAFDRENIRYVELLESLRQAAGNTMIYPRFDGHPNGNGYRVIARAVADYLGKERL